MTGDKILLFAYSMLWVAWLIYSAQLASHKRWLGQTATWITTGAWSAFTLGLFIRSLAAGHWPITNRYEVGLGMVWTMLGIYLLLLTSWRGEQRGEKRGTGACVLAMALLAATYAFSRPSVQRNIIPLPPALRSPWLQIHVLSAVIAYSAFGVAAGLGLLDLLPEALTSPGVIEITANAPVRSAAAWEGRARLLRLVSLGFPWLTLSILSGAIWAQNVWGRYWAWDPKESWTSVIWLWYLLILHIHPLARWRGRRLATLVVVGFGVVLFTFAALPWLFRILRLESLHSFGLVPQVITR